MAFFNITFSSSSSRVAGYHGHTSPAHVLSVYPLQSFILDPLSPLLPPVVPALVCMSSCNKNVNWVAYKQHLFFPVLEAGKSEIKVLIRVSGKDPLRTWRPFTVFSPGGRCKGCLWGLFPEGTGPVYRAPSSGHNHLPSITFRVRLSAHALWRSPDTVCSNPRISYSMQLCLLAKHLPVPLSSDPHHLPRELSLCRS